MIRHGLDDFPYPPGKSFLPSPAALLVLADGARASSATFDHRWMIDIP